ncbi:LytR/AlgR family response regulator transcription factor [Tepidibacter formicigenes]|jgi:DNA-binding LytR/AlgR family response regulator|uniref:Stage 0 sporulation protein A homolog n=1 Tax=Tepidibacter formicigenes DSM 15518 TaxID=1123349 RepID=A0A1M6KPB0_9FIRM|nr:LytTR family DNA-binding domain-containing protein [Tepidibacter formicigenes]SHJ60741.1 two component transcriptional regulator, LytTR family [Tepidibacter formicigenes DSM 15518]
MGVKVLVCDDDKVIRNHIVRAINNIKDIEFIKTAENGVQAVQNIKKGDFDILIIDVDMPHKNGIDAAKEICKVNPDIYIIFVTAFKEYALDAFSIYSLDYILKPFNEKRLLETLSKAVENINIKKIAKKNLSNNKEKFIFKKSREKYIINLEDIIMFEKNGRITKIYTKDLEVDFYESFYDIEKRLSMDFFRTHKSYIVNINKVKRIVPHIKSSYQIEFKDNDLKALLSKKNEIKLLNKLYLIRKKVI